MDTREISRALDEIFDKTWSNREYNVYKLLEDKLVHYRSKAKIYETNTGDREEILANLTEQPWLLKSKHRSVVVNLIKSIDVMEYHYSSHSKETKLHLKVQMGTKNKFTFNINYLRTDQILKYKAYYENSKHRGYVCYLDSTKSESELDLKLPDYDKILSVLSIRQMDKYDVLHIATELLFYYDEDKEIRQAHMGHKYPLSLAYLASVTNN